MDCGAPVPPDATIIKAQGGKPLKEHATLYTVGTLARSTLNTSSRLDDCESRASLRAEVLQRTGMLIAVGGPCCPRRVFAEFGFIVAHPGIWVYANMGGAGAGACAMWGCGWPVYPSHGIPFSSRPPQTWRRHHVTSAANSWDAGSHSRHARKHLHATQPSTTSLRRAAEPVACQARRGSHAQQRAGAQRTNWFLR